VVADQEEHALEALFLLGGWAHGLVEEADGLLDVLGVDADTRDAGDHRSSCSCRTRRTYPTGPANSKCNNRAGVLGISAEEDAMSATDELLKNNEAFADGFDKGDLPLPPGKKVAVVACMDARVNPYPILGLELGDAHVIRNAGGVVTDDEIRSLAISQRLLGTTEIMLIHHRDCGMLTFSDDDFRRQLKEDTGVRPEWAAEAFSDLEDDVRQSIARIKASPFIPNKDTV